MTKQTSFPALAALAVLAAFPLSVTAQNPQPCPTASLAQYVELQCSTPPADIQIISAVTDAKGGAKTVALKDITVTPDPNYAGLFDLTVSGSAWVLHQYQSATLVITYQTNAGNGLHPQAYFGGSSLGSGTVLVTGSAVDSFNAPVPGAGIMVEMAISCLGSYGSCPFNETGTFPQASLPVTYTLTLTISGGWSSNAYVSVAEFIFGVSATPGAARMSGDEVQAKIGPRIIQP
jgi:hypothetical protein